MRLRRFFVGIALVMAATLGLFTAGPARAAPAVVFGPPAEGAKVTLADTSIDGPALWTSFTGTTRAVIAWTGTDPQHHLNFMTSSDGLHYGNKHILSYTSLWRPAVAYNVSGRGEPYGTIVLAWTSASAPHTLNVAYIATPTYEVVSKLTFPYDTSFTAPALTILNDTVYIAWAGTDSNHSLNIVTLSRTREVAGHQTFWQWGSISRPDLSYDWATNAFLLAWTGVNNRLYFAESPLDTAHFSMPSSSPLREWSDWAPSMHGFSTNNMPVHWLAWTGAMSDTQHHVNVQYTESYPSWANVNSKTTFDETAISSPELGYVGVNRQVLVSWTGTDAAHHLNVAVIAA